MTRMVYDVRDVVKETSEATRREHVGVEPHEEIRL
jgi:hypothetical protein